jgi:hypothetical protein
MKKIKFVLLLGFVLLLSACIQPVSNVLELELVGGWEPKTQYAVNESVNLTGTQIKVTFDDNTSQTVSISSSNLTLQGSGINSNLTLNTATSGEKEVVIAYGTVTLTVRFLVYNVKVNSLANLQAEIANNKVIVLEDGQYSAATGPAVSISGRANVIITSETPHGATIKLTSANALETIVITNSHNVIIQDLVVERENGTLHSQAIAIRGGGQNNSSSNITVRNNILRNLTGSLDGFADGLTIHENTSNITVSDNLIENFMRGMWIGDHSFGPVYVSSRKPTR